MRERWDPDAELIADAGDTGVRDSHLQDVVDTEEAFDTGSDVTDSGDTSDAGDVTDGDTGADVDGGGEVSKSGYVVLVQTPTTSGARLLATASFFDVPEIPDGAACEETKRNGCALRVCSRVGEDRATTLSAGKLSVKQGKYDFDLRELEDKQDRILYRYSGMAALWDGNQTLNVSGNGGSVPDFSISIDPPAGGLVDEPSIPMRGDVMIIDTNKGLRVSWPKQTHIRGKFYANLVASANDGRSTEIFCNWPMDRRSMTIPSELLGEMLLREGSFRFAVGTQENRVIDGMNVEVSAFEFVRSAEGNNVAEGLAQFQ